MSKQIATFPTALSCWRANPVLNPSFRDQLYKELCHFLKELIYITSWPTSPTDVIYQQSLAVMVKHQTIARSSLLCARRAAIKRRPPSNKETPEYIDRERYPYFSTRAPLMGTFAIALQVVSASHIIISRNGGHTIKLQSLTQARLPNQEWWRQKPERHKLAGGIEYPTVLVSV